MYLTKNCAECGNPFETKRKDKKYCSDKCKSNAFHKKNALGFPDTSTTAEPVVSMPTVFKKMDSKIDNIKLPSSVDVSAQFVIESLKERVSELKDDLKESVADNKVLIKEKSELEKQLESVKRDLESKPSGLQGFITNNPGLGEKALEMFGPMLANLAEKAMSAKQLSGGQESTGENPVWNWLITQPKEVQAAFVQLCEGLSRKPEKIMEYLNYFNKQWPVQNERFMRTGS